MKVLGKGYGFILVILLSVTAFSALDGFNPETILIGKQVWMLKNYHPSMISPAPKVKGVSYLFRSNIDPKYGTLLTYEEAVAACPEGWHLPTMAEWNELFALYGGLDTAGGHLKTVDFWKAPNTGADNLSGFSALPAGGGNDTNRFDGFRLVCALLVRYASRRQGFCSDVDARFHHCFCPGAAAENARVGPVS